MTQNSAAALYQQWSADWQSPDPLPQQAPRFFQRSAPTPVPPPPLPGTPPQHVSKFGATAVFSVPAVGLSGTLGAVWPAAGVVTEVAVGGIAVAAVIGPINGGWITNGANAVAQGLAVAENLYFDMVNPPGSSDATAYGTTVLLTPAQNFSLPALATGVVVWVNCASSGHKFSITIW